jgi:DNA-binding NarL/FixJ family response regulator
LAGLTEDSKAKDQAEADLHRMYVIENQLLLRLGIAAFLEKEFKVEICGESELSGNPTEQVLAAKADLVVLGVDNSVQDGIEIVRGLRSKKFSGKILVLSSRSSLADAELALRRGADGYISKNVPTSEFTDSIRTVMDGHVFVSPEMRDAMECRKNGSEAGSENGVGNLTRREHEVLGLIGKGLNTRKIADNLGLSSKTIDVHRGNIKKKLQIRTVNELIRFAVLYLQ